MASPFHLPVTAAQVGNYFVGEYYKVLQHQPDYVHQFYSEASTIVRIDGDIRETASALLQIHRLIMSLNYTGIEIKTANSLESWNGGVLVMVSGYVHLMNFNGRRKFVQTFFLAPQERGYFVFSDIFHFIEEDHIPQLQGAYLAPTSNDSTLNTLTAFQDQAPNYKFGGDFQPGEFAVLAIDENDPIDNYDFPEQRLQHTETEHSPADSYAVQSNGSLQSTLNLEQEHLSTPCEEPVGKPQRHTYASILQVAKGQSSSAVPSQSSFSKITPPASEWNHVPEPSSQPSFSTSVTVDKFWAEAAEEISAVEDEVEIKSVYVRNLPSSSCASEIEEEFKKFGKLKPNGVAIISRKDIDVFYAFVEFEDIAGVQNAIKASTVQISGQQVYIEGRRANRFNVFHGGRGRGRGRGSYHMDASRGRFGAHSFSRSSSQDVDYRPRGNGYHRPSSRQERVFSGDQQAS